MKIEKQAKELISKLSFEECIKMYEALPAGHIMIDWIFDRMEELDSDRFENWL